MMMSTILNLRHTLSFILLVGILGSPSFLLSQEAVQDSGAFSISGFADLYAGYDFGNPNNGTRPDFIYNHHRVREFNLNLGYLRLAYQKARYEGVVTLQTGTYAQANYAAEPVVLRSINEARISVGLGAANNWRLDAGIMPSNVGFESAVSADNWTLTRSISAENSPYYMSGIKVRRQNLGNWEIGGVLMNGWQKIRKPNGSRLPWMGTMAQYAPSERFKISWNTLSGTDERRLDRGWRMFSNLYGIVQLNSKLGMILGFDIGWQQDGQNLQNGRSWLVPTGILRYGLSNKLALALRGEYFKDGEAVILANGAAIGGVSLNLDYQPFPELFARIEGKFYQADRPVFVGANNPSQQNFAITASLALRMEKIWGN